MIDADLDTAIRAEFSAQAAEAPDPAKVIARVTDEVWGLRTDRPVSRVRWVWLGDVAGLAVLMVIVISTVLFLKPSGGHAPAEPGTAVSATPAGDCASPTESSGPAASSVRLTVRLDPSQVVSPGEELHIDAQLQADSTAPTINPEAQIELLALRDGRVLGMLTPSPLRVMAGQALTPGSSAQYSMSYGGSMLALTTAPGCPAPVASALAANATYQIVAVARYRSGATASTLNRLVSNGVSLSVLAPDRANATKTVFFGRMRELGGPAPRQSVPVAGRIRAYTTADTSGTPFAETDADTDGRFTFTLPAGTYYLTGESPADPGVACYAANKSLHGDAGSVLNEDLVLVVCPYK